MTEIDQRLAAKGLAWPEPPKPVASYVPAVRSGSWIVVSGQLPFDGLSLTAKGRVPSDVSLEAAQSAAAHCALNALSVVRAELGGDLSRLVRVVRIGVFVQSAGDFHDQAKIANGASDLIVDLLGDAGKHARAAVGTNALPLDAPVELEMIVEVA
jgi:enamine deaminase RidA (YjgF/YER057c/UK114 family)